MPETLAPPENAVDLENVLSTVPEDLLTKLVEEQRQKASTRKREVMVQEEEEHRKQIEPLQKKWEEGKQNLIKFKQDWNNTFADLRKKREAQTLLAEKEVEESHQQYLAMKKKLKIRGSRKPSQGGQQKWHVATKDLDKRIIEVGLRGRPETNILVEVDQYGRSDDDQLKEKLFDKWQVPHEGDGRVRGVQNRIQTTYRASFQKVNGYVPVPPKKKEAAAQPTA